jgi:uncharacterized protein (TIGR00730 family)
MNICIFGASSDRIDPKYYEAAEDLGALMARDGHRLVFGGGKEGLMGACARGLLRAGGHALGIAPRFFDEPGILLKEECDFLFTETMSERKRLMEDQADAFIVLPGGIGTYEEFFETLTLKQLGRHAKPMALLNTLGYYNSLVQTLETAVRGGFLSKNCLSLFALCDTPEEALQAILTAPTVSGSPKRIVDYNK